MDEPENPTWVEDAIEAMFLLRDLLAANSARFTEEGARVFDVLSDAETSYYLGVTVDEEEVWAAIEVAQSRPESLFRYQYLQSPTAEAARSWDRAETNESIGYLEPDSDEDYHWAYIGDASLEGTNVTAMR
jgi:hypothetical protein